MGTEEVAKKILEKITSRGDIGAASVSFALGFLGDVLFLPGGTPAATTAVVATVGGLGLKNSLQAAWGDRRARKDLNEMAGTLETLLTEEGLADAKRRLQLERDLWEKGLTTEEEFEGTLRNAVEAYGEWKLPGAVSLMERNRGSE